MICFDLNQKDGTASIRPLCTVKTYVYKPGSFLLYGRIAIEKRHDLATGAGRIRAEGICPRTRGDPHVHRPGRRLGVRGTLGHVGKVRLPRCRAARQPPEIIHCHTPGTGGVPRKERPLRQALIPGPGGRVGVPSVIRHVGAVRPRCRAARRPPEESEDLGHGAGILRAEGTHPRACGNLLVHRPGHRVKAVGAGAYVPEAPQGAGRRLLVQDERPLVPEWVQRHRRVQSHR